MAKRHPVTCLVGGGGVRAGDRLIASIRLRDLHHLLHATVT